MFPMKMLHEQPVSQMNHVLSRKVVCDEDGLPMSRRCTPEVMGTPMTEGEVLIQGLCEVKAEPLKYFRL